MASSTTTEAADPRPIACSSSGRHLSDFDDGGGAADLLQARGSDELTEATLCRFCEPVSASNSIVPRHRVRLVYNDEGLRTRFCANAQRLLDAVGEDPHTSSTSSRLALKALRYRNIMRRVGDVDRSDPNFDISSFFGVEWSRGASDEAK
jgi:hypothetical protein